MAGENFFRGKKVFPHTPFQKTELGVSNKSWKLQLPQRRNFKALAVILKGERDCVRRTVKVFLERVWENLFLQKMVFPHNITLIKKVLNHHIPT